MPYLTYDTPEGACGCAACREERGERGNWRDCEHCGEAYDYDREGSYDYCSPCLEEYYSDDYDDYDEGGEYGAYVHNYSYVPSLNFTDAGYDDPDRGRLHLGIELEVPTDDPNGLAESIYRGPGRSEELLYCKEDGSIEGVEIVSHPMTHQYFRQSFPFSMFERSSDQSRYLRTRRPNDGYGLHVHVSRSGFKSESHALRFLLLIYRNSDEVERLARRESGSWTSFRDADRCEEKAAGRGAGDRYVAVNACNADTFEIRVFRSTWTEREFRAAVDFVHAAVVYTRQLTPFEALDGGLHWDSFRKWLLGMPEYQSLTDELNHLDGIDPIPGV